MSALSLSFVPSLSAQDNPCRNLPQDAKVDASSGCFPLTVKPADGSPERTTWVLATFPSPPLKVRSSGGAVPGMTKSRELDLGLSAYYTKPDYSSGFNVDVGAFVAYSGKYFGGEVDAADTVRSGRGIHEPYIVAGPRFQYRTHYFTAYVKAQAGVIHFSGAPAQPINNRQTLVLENYGGGIEVKVGPHLKIRAVDINYQIVPTFSPNNLTPFHIGSGVAFSF